MVDSQSRFSPDGFRGDRYQQALRDSFAKFTSNRQREEIEARGVDSERMRPEWYTGLQLPKPEIVRQMGPLLNLWNQEIVERAHSIAHAHGGLRQDLALPGGGREFRIGSSWYSLHTFPLHDGKFVLPSLRGLNLNLGPFGAGLAIGEVVDGPVGIRRKLYLSLDGYVKAGHCISMPVPADHPIRKSDLKITSESKFVLEATYWVLPESLRSMMKNCEKHCATSLPTGSIIAEQLVDAMLRMMRARIGFSLRNAPTHPVNESLLNADIDEALRRLVANRIDTGLRVTQVYGVLGPLKGFPRHGRAKYLLALEYPMIPKGVSLSSINDLNETGLTRYTGVASVEVNNDFELWVNLERPRRRSSS